MNNDTIFDLIKRQCRMALASDVFGPVTQEQADRFAEDYSALLRKLGRDRDACMIRLRPSNDRNQFVAANAWTACVFIEMDYRANGQDKIADGFIVPEGTWSDAKQIACEGGIVAVDENGGISLCKKSIDYAKVEVTVRVDEPNTSDVK